MISRTRPSSLLLALVAAVAMGMKPRPGYAAEVEVNVPLVLFETPTVSSRAYGIGWGGGLGVQSVVDAAAGTGPRLRSATAAQVRGELNFGQTVTLGLQLTEYMVAGKLKLVANRGQPVVGKWSGAATVRVGNGSEEDYGSTSRYCPGWFVIFPTVASEWESSNDFALYDFGLVVGRRLSDSVTFFGGPFAGSVGYRARYTTTQHACGGGSSSQQFSADGDVAFRGVNAGYALQSSRGQLLIEAGVVRVADGSAEDTMLRLNLGFDFYFGRPTGGEPSP